MIADLSGDMKTWKQNGIGDGYLMNYSDASGAITRKTDLGYYTDFKYESSKPHAVTSLENLYDATPPLPSTQLAATYTNFKKLATLTEGNKSYALTYGVDDQRRRSTYSDRGTVKQTCYYLGDYELERQSDGSERSIHYLSGGDGLAAIYVTREFGRDTFMYAYTDNLGSITTLTDANHNVMERYAYDPWGGRRNPTNWAQKDNRTAWLTNRGYTGHEHLDRFGIINMNGRVYDPLTAMFLSPDPFVQAPGNWLNYNRYGYCYNNPFRYTDPSGEWIHIVIGAAIGGTMNWAANGGELTWKGLGYFGVGAASGAVGGALAGGISATLAGGSFISGALGTSSVMISSSFSSGAIIGFGSGFGGGFTMGLGNGLINGDGWNSLHAALRDGIMGGGSGMLFGGLLGGMDAWQNNRNFWTGEYNRPIRPPFDMKPLPTPEPRLKVADPQLKAQFSLSETMRSADDGLYALDNLKRPLSRMSPDGMALSRDPNFRKNLIEASGINPGNAYEAHHVFPVKYADYFSKVGVDVNRYGAWWATGSHRANSFQYNAAWYNFFQTNSNPSKIEIFNYLMGLRGNFHF